MQNKILLIFLFLISICIAQEEEEIIFKFPKTHYVKSNTAKKVIEVNSSISNDNLTLYINNTAKNEMTKCTPKKDDLNIFYCFISSYGEYKFNYTFNNINYQYDQSLFVVSSYEKLFKITPSRNSNCFYHKEIFSYTVELTNEYSDSIDLNNIQVFAYSPKSIVKQINSTEVIYFERELISATKAIFTINGEHTRNQFIVRITENEDYDDTLGNINSFSFTKVTINDNFFFPSLGKIRFYSDFCNFEPDFLILKTENKQDTFILNCEPLKCYFSKYCYCYFDKKIVTKYGKMELFYNETSLKKYILSIKPLSQISLNTSKSNNSNYKEVTFEIIDDNGDEFTLEAINKFYVEYGDDFEQNMKTFYKGFNLNYSDFDDKLSVTFKYLRGVYYKGIKLERILYEDEKIHTALDLYYYFDSSSNLYFYAKLDDLRIEPDLFVVGDLTDNYRQTSNLKFISSYAGQLYGNSFCKGNSPKATNQFHCYRNYTDYVEIEPSDSEPGILSTQLRYHTEKAYYKVINIKIENTCQNIYGDKNYLDDVIINVYFPKEENKKFEVKYNGETFEKNDKIYLTKNPFNYNFENFIIPADKIQTDQNIEFNYGGVLIGTKSISYSSVFIPPLTTK